MTQLKTRNLRNPRDGM